MIEHKMAIIARFGETIRGYELTYPHEEAKRLTIEFASTIPASEWDVVKVFTRLVVLPDFLDFMGWTDEQVRPILAMVEHIEAVRKIRPPIESTGAVQ